MHREKKCFIKYGGVFILVHDSFDLRNIFIVSEVIHTEAYIKYFLFLQKFHLILGTNKSVT